MHWRAWRDIMAGSSRYPTHLILDDSSRYARGEIVHVDES
jgi:hypothetical protein